ncbi:UDP-3-O-(3-hydroxymyristoyl)glucosamine N-acyltransferase [Candidatus Zixiibacteriota bacterium]
MAKKKNKSYSIAELAEKIGAKFDGDGSIEIYAAAPVETATEGYITFIANPKYLKHIKSTKASAIVLDDNTKASGLAVIRHPNPYYAFSLIIDILYSETFDIPKGIDKSAVIEDDTEISSEAAIGPLCHIKSNTRIGNSTRLLSSVFVGSDVCIGENCLIYPGVRILNDSKIGNNVIIHSSTVVGSDGFGFAESDQGLKKIKQIGWVEIEDNVEIGSNCSIDRGALGPTRIGAGTKIDNLVQIAHNVEIGKHCIIVAQVGISGSTKLGNGVILAGQVGVVGHIELGDGVKVGAQSGVAKSVDDGKAVFGSPARDILESKKIEAALRRLPDLLKRVRKLEKK